MALAGVTGGELRIHGTEPDDLRMIRLVFRRLGLRDASSTAPTCSCRAGSGCVAERDVGEYKAKVQDGPWPAFPADLTSIAVALATQCEGSVLIHEWMFENRMIFTDKLVLDGRGHHHLRPAPGDRQRPEPAARRARGVARHPRGHGHADRRLCAEGRSEIGNIRQIDRGYERIDERLRALGARIERVAAEPAVPVA